MEEHDTLKETADKAADDITATRIEKNKHDSDKGKSDEASEQSQRQHERDRAADRGKEPDAESVFRREEVYTFGL